MNKIAACIFLINLILNQLSAQVYTRDAPFAHTYSIVARDPETGEMGVAVQSNWFSVGTVVIWAEAGVGAIATQSFVNKSFGPRGLDHLRRGNSARETLDSLLITDSAREVRQVAIVDTNAQIAAHTGKNCIQFASHRIGSNYSVQANMMLGAGVPDSMAASFERSAGLPLGERLLLALEAAQRAGGDIRGQQSAAILVVPGRSAGKPWDERTVDLRVGDHASPLKEIRRLYLVHLAYQHMNNGDLAIERNDMASAMKEYNAAMKMMPGNLEMQFWTGITLANGGKMDKALPLLKNVFRKDKNWKELARRLKRVNLLTVNEEDHRKILELK